MDFGNYMWFRAEADRFDDLLSSGVSLFDAERRSNLSHLLCEAARGMPGGIGGSSFRSWYAGVFRRGVYVFAHNHRVGVLCTESPDATVTAQCQNAAAYGDPRPKPSSGEWLPLDRVPEPVRPVVLATVTEILRDVVAFIRRRSDEWSAKDAARKAEAAAKRRDVVAAWSRPTEASNVQ